MKQSIIYALDFDGVICNSAVETGISGWKTARKIWDDFNNPLPAAQLIKKFTQVRPILETGYEAILLTRLLHEGKSVEFILNNFSQQKQRLLDEQQLNIASLKTMFAETRDHWIKSDLDNWVENNPLFSGVKEKLQYLGNDKPWYIITTKQERFVKYILEANNISLPRERIFGLDRNMSKNEILQDLVKQHSLNEIHFVEDRLPTLIDVQNNKQLDSVKLFFAFWGYSSMRDKLEAEKQEAVKLITLDEFLD